MGADIAEVTQIPRPPRGREDLPTQLKRLLDAHQLLLEHVRTGAKKSAEAGDDGTNDLLVSGPLRTNEMQVWFLAEHLESLAPAGK
jgi:starvation-inducible DNA-binding protein